MAKPYPTRGDPVCAEHNGSKGVNLEKNSPILRCECHVYGISGDLPGIISALPSVGFLLGGPYISPLLVGPKWSKRMKT